MRGNLGINQVLVRALLTSCSVELFDVASHSLIDLSKIGLPLRFLISESNGCGLGIKLFLARRELSANCIRIRLERCGTLRPLRQLLFVPVCAVIDIVLDRLDQ